MDVIEYNNYLQAKTIILFHSEKEKTKNIISKLKNDNVNAMCLTVGKMYRLD